MNLKPMLIGWLLVTAFGCSDQQKTSQVSKHAIPTSSEKPFSIEILDDQALKVISRDATIERMASGFDWVEGPLWIGKGDYLLFSDIPRNKVYKMTSEGDTSTYLNRSGYSGEGAYSREPGSNALLLDKDNQLVLMQHGNRKVAKMKGGLDAPAPDFTSLVHDYQGKRLNSPNDGIFDKQGNLYFTDPPYGLPPRFAGKELSFQGIYCLKTNGTLVLLDSLSRPNGIALSPDEKHLFVANSDEKNAAWFQYPLEAPGEVDTRSLFYDATEEVLPGGRNGLPDGMKVHPKGYLFATGPDGIWIFDLKGKVLGKIHTGQLTSNCTFTDDYKHLYVTAHRDILRVDLK
ncbi:SMP-30/gluconolactonase/LRE family protein [Echinicola vietnamensis]|uniref:Gluconolactonase n=1 Tax=Echinicola vietnamensis (strain DSM 17526 / LMG 23754 / KMM 6221) TaxID=926556 RepID=L0G194_ECHVK|nr:SMP-30/gluconolactonase/LRE family protein [Echinicola vietnamensis]AGA79979.1 gluconolactonase [Echinicola vietnamensis DSM 17526]